MSLDLWLWIAIAAPLAAAGALVLLPTGDERTVVRIARAGVDVSAGASLVALVGWIAGGAHALHGPTRLALGPAHARFAFALVLDVPAAVFLALAQLITATVVRFSRFYLHREPGFRRFFATVLLLQAGICVLVLADHLDLMFAGWELVGLSSFLLIAFYRERQAAVRSALKTYSVYRVADAGMLLAACLEGHPHAAAAIGCCVLVAAMGKSAQFPFSFWVPRAMEGPTPSSALFYGALSVHAGAYLLLRTFELWSGVVAVRVLVAVIGGVTAIACTMFGGVQSTIKGQVGYASVAQVGVIFVEIALGLPHLALAHIVCNAAVRCYQLLISPSVVAHRLREQAGAGRRPPRRSLLARVVPARWFPTLYVFALSEGYVKDLSKLALWFPLRGIGERLARQRGAVMVACASAAAAVPLLAVYGASRDRLPAAVAELVLAAAAAALALARWRSPARAFAWITGSLLLVAQATLVLSSAAPGPAAMYTLAVVLAGVIGALGFVAAGSTAAVRFAGKWAAHPRAGALALVGALGLAGLPVWPTFFGEDALIRDALAASPACAIAIATLMALDGYLAMRAFAYVFYGDASRAIAPAQ